jgi:hypothetical protein
MEGECRNSRACGDCHDDIFALPLDLVRHDDGTGQIGSHVMGKQRALLSPSAVKALAGVLGPILVNTAALAFAMGAGFAQMGISNRIFNV